MNGLSKGVFAALFWVAVAGHALANPEHRGQRRELPRAARQERFAEPRGMAPGARFLPPPAPPELRRGFMTPGSPSGRGPVVSPGVPLILVPGEYARPRRLTPDELRILRRQINEAGRDIYAPRR